jgi:hypothetical protein
MRFVESQPTFRWNIPPPSLSANKQELDFQWTSRHYIPEIVLFIMTAMRTSKPIVTSFL